MPQLSSLRPQPGPLAGLAIGFVGGGNMAEALIAGLTGGDTSVAEIMLTEPNAQRVELLRSRYGVRPVNLDELAGAADVVVIAVKPQVVDTVLAELAEVAESDGPGALLRGDRLLVSIAAGIPAARFEAALPGLAVIRVMPNTPALIGEGMSVLSPGRQATRDHLRVGSAIMATAGRVLELPERMLDAVTAVSGSGPAYFFYLAEALTDVAQHLGLDPQVATELVVQTALGAARMLRESGRGAAQLREAVTSPGGTTAAALDVLESSGTRQVLHHAVRAARDRAAELGGG